MKHGEKITFDGFKDALVDRIINMCINVNQKILPDTFKYQDVKSWTNVITEEVYPSGGTPYQVTKAFEYHVLQCPNSGQGGTEMVYNKYTTREVKNIINNILTANGVDYIVNNIMYAALFMHVIKILERFISENFIIYVSPFYNSQLIVFAPTGNYNYGLPIDIRHTGDDAYSKQQIENYLTNFSKTIIYSIPSNNIKLLTYGIKCIAGVPIPVPKKDFIINYNYTSNTNSFTVSVSLPAGETTANYKTYYKKSANSKWVEFDQSTATFSATATTTFYFYVSPNDNTTWLNYNELGKDNKTGFKLTKSFINVNPHSVLRTYTYGPHGHWYWYYSDKDRARREHPGGWESRFYWVWWGWSKFDWAVYETTYDRQAVWSGSKI